MIQKLKHLAQALWRDTVALYLAARDPRTPWHARLFALFWVVFALSPIELIPSSIPILRDFGELILLPLGYVVALRLVPEKILSDCRKRAEGQLEIFSKAERLMAVAVVLFWIAYAIWMPL